MLVLSRKLQERILLRIGDVDVWVVVVDIDRGKIRLGIDAPSDIVIVREELLPVAEKYAATVQQRRVSEYEETTISTVREAKELATRQAREEIVITDVRPEGAVRSDHPTQKITVQVTKNP